MASTVTIDPKTIQPLPQATPQVTIDPSTIKPISSPGIGERYSEITTGTQHPIEQAKSEYRQLKAHPVDTLERSAKTAAMLPVDLAYNLTHHPIDTLTGLSGGKQFQEDLSKRNWRGMVGDLAGAATLGLTAGAGGEESAVPKEIRAAKEAEPEAAEAGKLPTGAQLLKPSQQAALKDAYVHTKGLQLAGKVNNAVQAIHDEIGVHAKNIANTIDTAHPEGYIDATALRNKINSDFEHIVKTPETSSFLKDVNQDILSPEQKPGRWTWGQAQQIRSKLGALLDSGRNPPAVKAFLKSSYGKLTQALKTSADQAGLGDDFETYNTLHRNLESNFGELAGKIANAKSGEKFHEALSADRGLTREFINNLQKYGVNRNEIANYQKIASEQMRSPFRKSIFRLVYGSPAGLAGYMAGHVIGAPWIASLGIGAGAGGLSEYVRSLRAALKINPDEIDSFLKSPARTLQGRTPLATASSEFLNPPTKPPTGAPPAPRPITPHVPSEAEILRQRVPIELQPRPGERPFQTALDDILRETAVPESREKLAKELQDRLNKKASAIREKANIRAAFSEVQEALKQYRAKKLAEAPPSLVREGVQGKPSPVVIKHPETATFDALPQADKSWIVGWQKEIYKLPKIMKDSELEDLEKYGQKGSPLREKLAKRYLAEKNKPPEPGATEIPPTTDPRSAVQEQTRQMLGAQPTQRSRDFEKMRYRYEDRERDRYQ